MSLYTTSTPRIASYVILRRGGKVAFVRRKNTSWMDGFYGLPSGKIEKEEQPTTAAIREAKEEVGVAIKIDDIKCIHVMHRIEGTEWIDFYFEVIEFSGEPFNAEPEMHSEMAWLDLLNLPEKVIPSTKVALESISGGINYSEFLG